jgi:hypothetical protein
MNGYIKSIGTQNTNELHEDYQREINIDLDDLLTIN